jgi:hypothetical protein
MKRLLLALALLLTPLVAVAQDAEWQTIVSRDLRFRLEMPSPAEQTVTREGEKGLVSPRTAWESKLDAQMFDFDFVDYEEGWFSTHDSKEMARDLGRGEAEKAFPRDKYKYVLDEPVTLQGWDGYALDIDAPDGQSVMMRTYIVRDRLYRMLVTHKDDAKTRDAATRFLQSLKLADTK